MRAGAFGPRFFIQMQDDRKIRPMKKDKFSIIVYSLLAVMFVLQFVIIFGIL